MESQLDVLRAHSWQSPAQSQVVSAHVCKWRRTTTTTTNELRRMHVGCTCGGQSDDEASSG